MRRIEGETVAIERGLEMMDEGDEESIRNAVRRRQYLHKIGLVWGTESNTYLHIHLAFQWWKKGCAGLRVGNTVSCGILW